MVKIPQGRIYHTISVKQNGHRFFAAMARSVIVLRLNLNNLFSGFQGNRDLIECLRLAYAHYVAEIVIDSIRDGGNGYLNIRLHELQYEFIDGLNELADGINPLGAFNAQRLTAGLYDGMTPDSFEQQLLAKIHNDSRHMKLNMEKMFNVYNEINQRIKEALQRTFEKSIMNWEKSLRYRFKSPQQRADEIKRSIRNNPAFAGSQEHFFIGMLFQDSLFKKLKEIYILRDAQLIGYP